MPQHHPQVRAADHEQEIRAAEGMIPQILQLAGDAGIDFQQIGKLIEQEPQSLDLRERGHLLPGLLPVGVGEILRRRGLGIGEVVDRLGERTQLVEGRGGFGDPIEHTPDRLTPVQFHRRRSGATSTSIAWSCPPDAGHKGSGAWHPTAPRGDPAAAARPHGPQTMLSSVLYLFFMIIYPYNTDSALRCQVAQSEMHPSYGSELTSAIRARVEPAGRAV